MEEKERVWLAAVFAKVYVFSGLPQTEKDFLIGSMQKRNYAKGDCIVNQGDEGTSFFIIYRGKVNVLVKKFPFRKVQVGTLVPEDFFGEMSLLRNEKRKATVEAAEDTSCFLLSKQEFNHMISRDSSFADLVKDARDKRSQELLQI